LALEKAKALVNDERLITKLFDVGIIDKLIEDLLKIHIETLGGTRNKRRICRTNTASA
jgi:hypothetical protein